MRLLYERQHGTHLRAESRKAEAEEEALAAKYRQSAALLKRQQE